jgi:hypothetical protein
MFITAPKRGKKGKNPGRAEAEQDVSPSTMYGAAEFSGGRPDSSRRFTGLYGKNAKARNETDVETGADSRRAGRMFSWMKGESY